MQPLNRNSSTPQLDHIDLTPNEEGATLRDVEPNPLSDEVDDIFTVIKAQVKNCYHSIQYLNKNPTLKKDNRKKKVQPKDITIPNQSVGACLSALSLDDRTGKMKNSKIRFNPCHRYEHHSHPILPPLISFQILHLHVRARNIRGRKQIHRRIANEGRIA